MFDATIFFKDFIYFQREGSEGEREGEKHRCERETLLGCLSYTPQPGIEPATQACALTGNQAGDSLLCRTTPNPLSHTGQGDASTV